MKSKGNQMKIKENQEKFNENRMNEYFDRNQLKIKEFQWKLIKITKVDKNS